MKRKWFFAAVYFGILALLAIIIYALPSVEGLFERTYIAKFGEIDVSFKIDEAWILRNETVCVAKNGGGINRLAKEGELVSTGAGVVEISGAGKSQVPRGFANILKQVDKEHIVKTSGKAPAAGYVSFVSDGLESELAYDRANDITKKQLMSASNIGMEKTSSFRCASGEPVFKIVKNGDWGLVFFTDKAVAERFSKEERVTLVFNDDISIDGFITSVKKDGSEYRVLITARMPFRNFLSLRKTDVKIITASADGIIIKRKSIVKKKDRRGVIVKDALGKYRFKPISIKAENEEEAAIYEDLFMSSEGEFIKTVNMYDEILTAPGKNILKHAK